MQLMLNEGDKGLYIVYCARKSDRSLSLERR